MYIILYKPMFLLLKSIFSAKTYVIIIILLLTVIKDNTIRGLLVLLTGYLGSYTTNYRDKIICITIYMYN